MGWIFTDLLSEDTRIGTVRYSRNSVRIHLTQRWSVSLNCGVFLCVSLMSLLVLGLVLPERGGVHHSGILPEWTFKPLQTFSRRTLWIQICDCGRDRLVLFLFFFSCEWFMNEKQGNIFFITLSMRAWLLDHKPQKRISSQNVLLAFPMGTQWHQILMSHLNLSLTWKIM